MTESSFFVRLDEHRYLATVATAGPWSAQWQHGGPPSAPLAREITATVDRPDLSVARVSLEFLRPVPVGEVSVSASIVRPGKAITLADATLSADGEPALLARAWLVEPAPAAGRDAVTQLPDAAHPMPDDDNLQLVTPLKGLHTGGYIAAMDWVATGGGFEELGPGGAWGRPGIPLVAGEALTPLQRAMLIADSGSGVGLSHDLTEVAAVNVDLTVFFDRMPRGDWLHLDAHTTGTPGGTSFSSTDLADGQGRFARGVQTLSVRPARR